VDEVPIGHPHGPLPVREHHLVALAVALERASMAVGPPPIELEHEALLGPVRIDEVAI